MSQKPDARRDYGTGQFVSREYAEAHPDTTGPVTFPIDTVWVLSWTDNSDRSGVDSVYADDDVANDALAAKEAEQEARVRDRQAAGYSAGRQVWYTLQSYAITRKAEPSSDAPQPVAVDLA